MSSYEEEQIKELVISQAKMYLGGGKSLREIAELTNQSHVTVKRNFDVRLKDYDLNLYLMVQEKLVENRAETVEDEKISERVLAAYKLLVNENKTIIEIAEELGATEFIIYRDLTKRLSMMVKIAPQLVTVEMVENVKNVLRQHSLDNSLMMNKK